MGKVKERTERANSDSSSIYKAPFIAGRGTPFLGLRVGSCLILRNELS